MRLLTQKGRLLEQGRLLRKKKIRGGRLLSTVLNILLFKRVSSRFLRTVVSYARSFLTEPFRTQI